MKIIYLVCISLLTTISVNGQMNFPLPRDNPFWMEEHEYSFGCEYTGPMGYCGWYICHPRLPLYYKSDTIINGISYNRLYAHFYTVSEYMFGELPTDCPSTFTNFYPESLYAILRQDTINKIVYIWDDNSEHVLYDFKNIILGHDYPRTYNNRDSDSLIVVTEDTIFLENRYLRKWGLALKNEFTYETGFVSVIEGVGSTFGIITRLVPPFEPLDHLRCFSLNNDIVYTDSSFSCDNILGVDEYTRSPEFSIYPNPASNLVTIELENINEQDCFIRIINTFGLEVSRFKVLNYKTYIDISQYSKGMYFVLLNNNKTIESRILIKE